MNGLLILAAATGSNTTAGAVLTVAMPIIFVLVMLAIWIVALRSRSNRDRRRGGT